MSLYFPLDDAVRKARRLEVALPAEVEAGYDRLVELATRLEELSASGMAASATSELNAAFAETFEAGDDPLAGSAVMAGLAGLGHAGVALAGALEAQAKRFLGQHAEAIFASFGPVFVRAADALVEVHGLTGSVSLKHLPRDAPRVVRAEVALAVVNDIVLVWKLFAIAPETTFRYDRTRGVLVIADVPPEIWWRTRPDTAGRLSAWDAVSVGFALSLATPATYRQRCRAIDDARDDVLRKIERESQPVVRKCVLSGQFRCCRTGGRRTHGQRKQQKERVVAERSVSVKLSARTDQYVSALKKAQAATTGLASSGGRDFTRLGSSMQSFGRGATLAVSVPLVALGAGAVNMASKFEQSFAMMQGLASVPASELDSLKESVLDLAGQTAIAPQELAEAFIPCVRRVLTELKQWTRSRCRRWRRPPVWATQHRSPMLCPAR